MTTRPPLAIARFLTTGTLLTAAFATAGIGVHLAEAAHSSTSTYAASVTTTSGASSASRAASTGSSSTAGRSTGTAVGAGTQPAQTTTSGS